MSVRQQQPSVTAHVSPNQVQVANNQQTYIRVANCQTVRMKEEKEVLEHFAGVFTMMNPLTFKEIFQTTVPYMVERISKNYALQVHAVSHVNKKWGAMFFSQLFKPIHNNSDNNVFSFKFITCAQFLVICFFFFPRLWQILSWPTCQRQHYLPPSLWSIFLRDYQRWAPMLSSRTFTSSSSN